MKAFDVNITGSGTKDEIVNALKALIETISTSTPDKDIFAEDEILCSEITETDE